MQPARESQDGVTYITDRPSDRCEHVRVIVEFGAGVLRTPRLGGTKVYGLEHLTFYMTKRLLASAVMLSMPLLSSAVNSCEISCFCNDVPCGDAVAQRTLAAPVVRSPRGGTFRAIADTQQPTQTGLGSNSGAVGMQSLHCDNDLCKNLSANAVLTTHAQVNRGDWMVAYIPRPAAVAAVQFAVKHAESPPPKSISTNPLSTTLRI